MHNKNWNCRFNCKWLSPLLNHFETSTRSGCGQATTLNILDLNVDTFEYCTVRNVLVKMYTPPQHSYEKMSVSMINNGGLRTMK